MQVFKCSGAAKAASAVSHIKGSKLQEQPEGIYKVHGFPSYRIIILEYDKLKSILVQHNDMLLPVSRRWFVDTYTYERVEEYLYLEVK